MDLKVTLVFAMRHYAGNALKREPALRSRLLFEAVDAPNVVAAFEAPAVVAGLDDVAMVGQAVERRGRHLGVASGGTVLAWRQFRPRRPPTR